MNRSASGFGTLLKQLRVDAGLSQEELAKRARVSVQAIGAYEQGTRRAPHRETFVLIAEALNLNGDRYKELVAAAERGRLRGPELPRETHNFPLALTELIGRDDVVSAIRTLVPDSRLVTLVGAGGIGKTRTALAVASGLIERFPDGIWFAELAAVSDPARVAGTIALALGIEQQADQRVLETLRARLREKSLLLVLDNCEHVVDEAARITEAILRESRGVRVLATSREALRIPGERVYRVPPLEVPPTQTLTAVEAGRFGAVALFTESAESSNQSFALTDRNASSVAAICRRLDGIPLAIELAAARVTALEPAQLVDELDQRFRILVGGSRTALPRQQTMRALIDWSHDLLSEKEQRLFRRLSLFSGGWTLKAATAVCSDLTLAGDEVLDVLSSLVDKSLVVAQIGGDEPRYDMLESMHAYALEKLDAAGERQEIARRHAQFVASFAAASLHVTPSERRRAKLRADVENIRTALAWSLTSDDALSVAARILIDSGTFLAQSLRSEMLETTRKVLQSGTHLDREYSAQLFIQISGSTVGSESLDAAEQAIALLEQGGVRGASLVRAYQRKSRALAQLRRIPEALETNRLAIDLDRELGATDAWSLRALHLTQGYLLAFQRDFEGAREAWGKARELAPDDAAAGVAHLNIAESYYLEGDVQTATRLAQECLEVFRRENFTYLEAMTLNNLANYRLEAGDRPGAAADLLAAVDAAQRAGDNGLMTARAIRHTAMLSAMEDDVETAGRLLGYSAASFASRGFSDPGDEHAFERLEARLRAKLGAEELQRLIDEGANLDEGRAWNAARAVIRRVAK